MAIFEKPKYSTQSKKKDIPKDLYTLCPISGEIIYKKELRQNLHVVPKSDYHFPINAHERINQLLDPSSFREYDVNLSPVDVLNFKDKRPYSQRIKQYQNSAELKDCVMSGVGTIGGIELSIAVMDFRFMAASMGCVAGEKITRTIERGLEQKHPVIIVSASGGARMQEGIYSLMQMAKTCAALASLNEARIPYISILTHPTTGGVTASFAALGDVILAEPKALIGFAGPRVIKETIKKDLPEGFQTAEFLLERGLIDQIVHRHALRNRLLSLLKAFFVRRI